MVTGEKRSSPEPERPSDIRTVARPGFFVLIVTRVPTAALDE
jgi:hypothetical protein